MAEGFEPSRELPPYTLSRRVPSAARAGHRVESIEGPELPDFRTADEIKSAVTSFSHHGPVRMGIILPGGTSTEQLELALIAERAGWDGVFAWEAAYGVDAWSLLAAIAARTSRVRLGTLLTPLPWRRPWK